MAYYIVQIAPRQYAKKLYMTDDETVVTAATMEFGEAQAVMLADHERLRSIRKNYPEAEYVEVVKDKAGKIYYGSEIMQPKYMVPRQEDPWMILQELRTFAMACDAEERSIQPHEILDRIPTRGK